MKAHVTDFEGVQHVIDYPEGWPLMEAIKAAGLEIKAECGGCCLCGTCHVYVDPSWQDRLPPISEDEKSQLEETREVTQRSRLSCQLAASPQLDGIVVALAPVY